MTHDGKNTTMKPRKNLNARRKKKLAIRNTGSGHHQTNGDERKKSKESNSGERENYSKSSYIAEIKGINKWAIIIVIYTGPS